MPRRPPQADPEDPFYETPARQRGGVPQPKSGGNNRPLAGADANNRSGSRLITLPTNSGSTTDQSFLNILSTPRGGGEDAEVINLLLDMDLPNELDGTNLAYNAAAFDVTAIVEWGIGGASFIAEVDWSSNGSIFSVKASNLKLSARLGPVAAILQPDVEVRLTGAVSYGSPGVAGISSPARRTFNLGAGATNVIAAGTASAVVAIPQWAVGVTVVDAGSFPAGLAVAPDWTLILTENFDGTKVSGKYSVSSRSNVANNVEGQFPIPLKARFAQLVNNLGTSMLSPKLIFNLAT